MDILSRVVADTNILVSQLILPDSLPAIVLAQVEMRSVLLFSESTMTELADVLSRPKFDRYVSREARKGFIQRIGRIAEFVPIIQTVHECRDPKDDKFLEVAWNGQADTIITGDADLLGMNPWRGIAVLSPAHFLGKVKS
ncbi:MAG: putative toxin-antitoxin system toxin component, PIN family [Candidatus Sulfotelmatobacter sp.]